MWIEMYSQAFYQYKCFNSKYRRLKAFNFKHFEIYTCEYLMRLPGTPLTLSKFQKPVNYRLFSVPCLGEHIP